MHAADEDILAAVVVVVADGNPIVEPRSRQAGLGGDIREVALPSFSKSRLEYFAEVFFNDTMSAPLVKKMSRYPSLL